MPHLVSHLLHRCWTTLVLLVAGLSPSVFAQPKETVLYSFQGGADGSGPVGSIVMDKQGNIFGATSYTNPCVTSLQCGSVYELSPPQQPGDPWTETTLYDFQGFNHGDGGSPEGGLVQDAAGNLYGTTAYGGGGPCILLGSAVGCGTVYELVRPQKPGGAWKEKGLYSFQGNQDGQFPIGDLVFDKRGSLYGATWFGGGQGATCDPLYAYCGTIFELTPPRTTGKNVWIEKVLHSFAGVDAGDGGQPNGGLILDEAGAIYGTTYIGGSNCAQNSGQGCGTLFQLIPQQDGSRPWSEAVLHSFGAGDDGGGPNGNLIFDKRGSLYGTTVGGGNSNFPSGAVFRCTRGPNDTYEETLLYSFYDGPDGGFPRAGLVFDQRGNAYGTAALGGLNEGGTLFRISAKTGSFVTIYPFEPNPDGNYPESPLIFDPVGRLYGTTLDGGTGQACQNYGCGTVYMVGP